jgi:mannose-1-phosphate guanylyltransferase
MQALILAGGEGTRLRPLTSTIPKPVVPLVDRPFIVYMLQWLRGHGVDDVILLCGFMSDEVKEVLGDGGDLGLRIRYVEEPRPLGTGGALRFAESLLDDRFLMLNGDVLTDIDLTAQLAQHERTGARGTLALVAVDDPTAYGLVRRNPNLSVREFLEKPPADAIDTNLVSAGAYVLERDVLDIMAPAGETISIERDVFPKLVGAGLYGYEASGYWLDIGTPERYLQATFDILEGRVRTESGDQLQRAGSMMPAGTTMPDRARAAGPVAVGDGCEVSSQATVGARTVLGASVTIADGAHVENSVLLDGCTVGPRSYVHSSIIGRHAVIGADCQVADGVVLGDQVKLGASNVLGAGARIFPNVELPDRAIKV